ncbi:MAG: hypothetical protein A2Y10_05505 [Planctomycetes bacterium GWF2_41_51]|nr:MAG: hypothetical protein A2Y10_05505 [Planctomycetes bacterium GWF2_41_51]HBG26785.1 hypothetical protein [Phycisphaerales bacterium]
MKIMNIKIFIIIFLAGNAFCADFNSWQSAHSSGGTINFSQSDNILTIDYVLQGNEDWVMIETDSPDFPAKNIPLIFDVKADSNEFLEIKFIDNDGTIFWRKISLKDKYKNWTKLVFSLSSTEYGWGGKDSSFDILSKLNFAVSGAGKGTVSIKNVKFGSADEKSTFPLIGPVLDPNRELPGFGFEQRRNEKLLPEDKLVLEYLKQVQDAGSKEKQLLPSMGLEDIEAQTFNNSLVAMAFMLHNEKERAERILNLYANAIDENNTDIALQNFYYNGEARGFFQWVAIRDCNGPSDGELHTGNCKAKAWHHIGKADRWMGDMVWLMFAYKFYEKEYNSNKYDEITSLIKNLLVSWYKDDLAGGGYIQHGWRKGDSRLHEDGGHHEGNIDAYALFKLTGDLQIAEKIKQWLDLQFKDKKDLPLDLYTWRVLAYGTNPELLDIPDYDLRFRKTLTFNGKKVTGFYHYPDFEIENIWLDGTGHIACAYIAYGDKLRGYFYANQLDNFLIEKTINNVNVKTLPYTANKTGGYEWVDSNKGFISVCAWYIIAKNKFNPMNLERY